MPSEQLVALQEIDDTYALDQAGDDSLALTLASISSPGTHRYWSLRFTSLNGDISLAEVELRQTIGGADATGAGTASTGGSISGAAANLVDNNTATYLTWTYAPASSWWTYDFGAGIAKEILEVALTPRQDGSNYSLGPASVALAYSDDNLNWTQVWNAPGLAWPSIAAQVFNASAAPNRFLSIATAMNLGASREPWGSAPWNIATLAESTPPPAGTGGNACF